MNSRKHIRSKLSTAVRVTSEGSAPIDVTLVDLSLHGMLVQAKKSPQVGQKCQIQILLGKSKNKLPIHAFGHVVRVRDKHFAVQFHSVGLGEGEELEHSILVHSDDPGACIKEFALSGAIFDPLTASSFEPYPVKQSTSDEKG